MNNLNDILASVKEARQKEETINSKRLNLCNQRIKLAEESLNELHVDTQFSEVVNFEGYGPEDDGPEGNYERLVWMELNKKFRLVYESYTLMWNPHSENLDTSTKIQKPFIECSKDVRLKYSGKSLESLLVKYISHVESLEKDFDVSSHGGQNE